MNQLGDWAPPIPKAASDAVAFGIESLMQVVKISYASIPPDAVLTQTALTGALGDIDEDPDTPDGNWMAGTGAAVLRVSFGAPAASLQTGVDQEFRVRIRPTP
jgi:hypothetical protein